MPAIEILLNGDGKLADVKDKMRPQGNPDSMRVITLDKGMTSGNPSVMIAFELADGTWVACETSVRLFQQAAAAMTGRYGYV